MTRWKQYSPEAARFLAQPLIEAAARIYFTTPEQVVSKKRHARLVTSRHAITYVLTHRHKMSRTMIGNVLGDRDNSTIWSAVKEADRRFAEDVMFRSLVEDLWPELRQRRAA